jgi:hypothetical protein
MRASCTIRHPPRRRLASDIAASAGIGGGDGAVGVSADAAGAGADDEVEGVGATVDGAPAVGPGGDGGLGGVVGGAAGDADGVSASEGGVVGDSVAFGADGAAVDRAGGAGEGVVCGTEAAAANDWAVGSADTPVPDGVWRQQRGDADFADGDAESGVTNPPCKPVVAHNRDRLVATAASRRAVHPASARSRDAGHCSGSCGWRVEAAWLETGQILNARIRPWRVPLRGPEARDGTDE